MAYFRMHVYLHVPFCARRCSYCDFAIAVRRDVPSAAYTQAVLSEWEGWRSHQAWEDSPHVDTVYFGGGTPSRLAPDALQRILDQIRKDRMVVNDAEITIEANPEDVRVETAKAWHDAGVNRVSLGVQSFHPSVLAWMHRTHTAEQVPRAVGTLRDAGFTNLSLDLIFGLPLSLDRDWTADLEQAFRLAPEHLSLYGLTVEPQTPLARWTARGDSTPVDEDRYAAEFLAADAALVAAGYDHYEVSNAARPGLEARHNGAYWRRAPYIGLGPSAHTGLGNERQWNLRDWAAYERAAAGGRPLVEGHEVLTAASIALENAYLGLRTRRGLPLDHVAPATRAAWCLAGWAVESGGYLRLTPEGWLRLDALVAALELVGAPSGS